MAAPGKQVDSAGPRNIVQFGLFEVDLSSGELRKHGVRLHLQTKPFQVLRALVERPGLVVSRDELRKQLWQEDTFVDFERGLNTAVNRLRIALGDSAETPRYIETLAKVGYRFIAEVSRPAADLVSAASVPPPHIRRRFSMGVVAAVAVLAVLCTLGAYTLVRNQDRIHSRQITFQRGQVGAARFAGDNTILYSARWENGPRQLYLTNMLSPESRPLGFDALSLASVSKSGELALLNSVGTGNIRGQQLFRSPMNGGAPVFVDDNIMAADWSPDGRNLAVVRAVDGTNQLESPIGKVLYRTAGWLSDIRSEPGGSRIAFVDHAIRHDDGGKVKMFDRGQIRELTETWASVRGLAWNERAREVWFTAAPEGSHHSVWAASPGGGVRQVTQYPGTFALRDISTGGSVLLSRETRRLEMSGLLAGDAHERALTWMDWSRVQNISHDGKLILFEESGEAVGLRPVSFLYNRETGRTEKIGAGGAMGLSPDEQWVLLLDNENRQRLRLAPIGRGTATPVPETGLTYQWARFLPNGSEAIALAEDRTGALGLFLIGLRKQREPIRLTSPMMVRNIAISPQGDRVAVLTPGNTVALYSTRAFSTAARLSIPEGFAPLKWSSNGQALFVQDLRVAGELPSAVYRFDLSTDALQLWKRIVPSDPIGVNSVTGVVIADDEKHYVYSYRRVLSELFAVQGLN